MSDVIIRPVQSMAEYTAAEDIQRVTWCMSELEIIPAHALHAMHHNGASLLGAFDGERMVGFAFAILATYEDDVHRIDHVAAARLKMYSVVAGVLPEYQSHDVGYRLKMAQRDFALRIGVRLITWTYDPLESRNGRFNVGKLGAVCHTYHREFHGEMSGINAGLATDRFEVEWWVTTPRVQSRATQRWKPLKLDAVMAGGAVLVNEATFNAAGLPVPPLNYVSLPSNLMLVEIPADFQAVKRLDFGLARRWRDHTRHLFEELFHSGFMVTDFLTREEPDGRRRSYYLLAYHSA